MQKVRILKVLAVMGIMLLLLPTNLMAERIPVAILRTNADGKTKTLTFTYAERPKVFARRGQNGIHRLNKRVFKDKFERYKDFYLEDDIPTWLDMKSPDELNYVNNDKITTVKFDKSFSMARPTSTFYWFCGLRKLKTIIGIENLNTSEVKSMCGMFEGCSSLTELDVSGFNTANVENMGSMFEGCSQLETIDVSGFNTTNVKNMGGMFEGCSQLETIDVNGFNTANVLAMMFMFKDCQNLKSVDISSFHIGKIISNFYACYSPAFSNLSENERTEALALSVIDIFSGCSNLRTLNVGGNDFSSLTSCREKIADMFKGVGTIDSPCRLIVNQQFDQSVLGPKHDNGNGGFYRWLNGYFTLDTARPESETNY